MPLWLVWGNSPYAYHSAQQPMEKTQSEFGQNTHIYIQTIRCLPDCQRLRIIRLISNKNLLLLFVWSLINIPNQANFVGNLSNLSDNNIFTLLFASHQMTQPWKEKCSIITYEHIDFVGRSLFLGMFTNVLEIRTSCYKTNDVAIQHIKLQLHRDVSYNQWGTMSVKIILFDHFHMYEIRTNAIDWRPGFPIFSRMVKIGYWPTENRVLRNWKLFKCTCTL